MKKGLISRMKATAGRIRETVGKVFHGTPEETAEERKTRKYGLRGLAIAAVALVVGMGSLVAVNAATSYNYYRVNPMGGSVYKITFNSMHVASTTWTTATTDITVSGKITNTSSDNYGKYTLMLATHGFESTNSSGKVVQELGINESSVTNNITTITEANMAGWILNQMESYFSMDVQLAGAYYSGHKLYGIGYVTGSSFETTKTPSDELDIKKASSNDTYTYTYTETNTSTGTSTQYTIKVFGKMFTQSSANKYTNIYYLWGDSNGDPYTISYYSASGSSNKLSYTTSAYYNYPVTVTTNKPTKTGYTFKNWNTSADGSGTSYSSGSTITVTADDKLYAQWTAKSQTVTFNNSGSTSTKTLTYGSGTNYSLTPPTKTGYTFKGWYTGSNGTGTKVWNADGTGNTSSSYWSSSKTWSNNSTSAMTVYAYWVANTYTITFHKNGGSGTDKQTMSVTYGASAVNLTSVSSLGYTKTGYTFGGWATSSSSTTVKYKDKASVSNLTEDLDLYAIWTVNTFTIKYNNNGGSGTMSNTTVTYGTSTKLRANTFTKTGYTFAGWYAYRSVDGTYRYMSTDGSTNESGDTTGWYEAGSQPSGWTYYIYSDKQSVSKTATSGTVTMYAVWEANTITVKYHANGGSGTMADSTFTYGVSTALSANEFTRTGYTFVGWYCYREVDSKYRYESTDGTTSSSGATTGWYKTADDCPGIWAYYVYKDKTKVSATATSGTVHMYALWSKDGAGWTMSDVIQDANMFYHAYEIEGGAGTTYDGNYTDSKRAQVDSGTDDPGYFTQDPYQ